MSRSRRLLKVDELIPSARQRTDLASVLETLALRDG